MVADAGARSNFLTTLSGSKVAWPVYASIGNIPKAIRRRPSEQTMMLIGLIPVAKHASMALILEPLKAAARDGIEIKCADGGIRLVYPMMAAHLGDWPEHATAGSTHRSRCPVCVVRFHERGRWEAPARLRTKAQTIDTIRSGHRGSLATMTGLKGLGLRPVLPYWTDHPWAAGPASITPDLLHQLWKGMYLDHIRKWWTHILGENVMDARQWQGNEARATASSFLAIVAGSRARKAVRAARCILDFLYRARMPQLDADDLAALDADLEIRLQRHCEASYSSPLFPCHS